MYYSGIINCDLGNGDGIGVTLFVSGCSLNCKGCFNPETHNKKYGKKFTAETEKYLFDLVSKPEIDHITFSGGNPLESYNLPEVTELARKLKTQFPDKLIWCYTGFVYEDIQNLEIMKYIDVLVDGPFVESLKDLTLPWRGSSNQRIIKKERF